MVFLARERKREHLGVRNRPEPVHTEEEESLSFGEKMARMRDRFKLGPHHRMERFSLLAIITASFLSIFIITSGITAFTKYQKVGQLSAVLTDSASYSISGATYQILGLYGSPEKGDVYTLLKTDDIDKLSTSSDKYNLFIRTSKSDSFDTKGLKASFVVFGSTGYAAVRLQASEPIQKQPINITIRSNADVTIGEAEPTAEFADESFKDYDQVSFDINPGAEGVTALEHVKPHQTDYTNFYLETITSPNDELTRDRYATLIKELRVNLNKQAEYEERIRSVGYVPPNRPRFIEGDKVSEDGLFEPSENVPFTVTIDTETKSLYDGYTKQVFEPNDTYSSFEKRIRSNLADQKRNTLLNEQSYEYDEIKTRDGKTVKMESFLESDVTLTNAEQTVVDSLQALTATQRAYVQLKREFQSDVPFTFLRQEYVARSVGETVNELKMDSKKIIFY